MKDLQDKMEYGEEDFSERLGRKKPEVEVLKIDGDLPLDEESEECFEEAPLEEEELPESPENKLKNRLLKLRG